MADNSDTEITGWSKEQTAFYLFRFILATYDDQAPMSVNGALALYSKCLSTVRYSAEIDMGKKIAKMAD